MSETKTIAYGDFLLPPSVVTKRDVSQLLTEAEQIDEAQTAAAIRQKVASVAPESSAMSAPLNDFLTQNTLTLHTAAERSALIAELRQLKDKAPVIHMTFAVPADRQSLGTLVEWLRSAVHRQALLEVGLQPGLVAGVYLRTPNHVHDFSLRAALRGRHDLLIKGLEKLRGSR